MTEEQFVKEMSEYLLKSQKELIQQMTQQFQEVTRKQFLTTRTPEELIDIIQRTPQ
jgi:mannitol/fructose-specific phosphotransferase system IIA component (Ntr-type)